MYKSISEKVLGFVGLTSIAIFDKLLIAIAAILIHSTIYSVVGLLYKWDIISGKFWGKACYFILWVLALIGCVRLAIICQSKTILLISIISILLIYNLIRGVVKIKLKFN